MMNDGYELQYLGTLLIQMAILTLMRLSLIVHKLGTLKSMSLTFWSVIFRTHLLEL